MVYPSIDPRLGEYTFDEIVIHVRNYMRYYINEKFLRGDITTNASTQRNPLIRFQGIRGSGGNLAQLSRMDDRGITEGAGWQRRIQFYPAVYTI